MRLQPSQLPIAAACSQEAQVKQQWRLIGTIQQSYSSSLGKSPAPVEHAQAGLQILSRSEQNAMQSGAALSIPRDLLRFFYRMNLKLTFWARPMIPYETPLEPQKLHGSKPVFVDIAQARDT
ncbi:hypothetical protein BDV59DRAFT_140619 [Aspergillus ambiguus]|uniref:uncharacterized protein n=1 Tax=Aspergillus ambiguus TaxID=176160 RepID=UPI003CCE4DF1